MNGIDIASHQKGIDVSYIDADFVIIKATQGDYYVNPFTDTWFKQGEKSGKCLGLYHYANGVDPRIEAEYFYNYTKSYVGRAIFFLDWESNGRTKKTGYNPVFGRADEVDWVYQFLTHFNAKAGVYPGIYMSASVTRRRDWSKVAEISPLWVAQYANDNLTGYQTNPYKDSKGLGAWKKEIIRQYSPSGTIKGFEQTEKHKLDLDIAYIDEKEWRKIEQGEKTVKTYKIVTPDVIEDVNSGKYGSGLERQKKLEQAGYNHREVQDKVNFVSKKISVYQALKKESGEYWDVVKNHA